MYEEMHQVNMEQMVSETDKVYYMYSQVSAKQHCWIFRYKYANSQWDQIISVCLTTGWIQPLCRESCSTDKLVLDFMN